jgi:hypothetical protein
MRQILKYLIVLILTVSCEEQKTRNNEESKVHEKKPEKTNAFITTIIKNSYKRVNGQIQLEEKNFLKHQIKPDFVKKYLTGLKLNNATVTKTEFDKYSSYYFLDYVDFADYFLFTIVHKDEVGYNNFFHYIYDKINNKISDVTFIASSGGEGGHTQKEILLYSKCGIELIVKSNSEYDEDLFDESNKNCYSRILDIYETKYNFCNGKTKITELASNIIKDTICY